MYTLKLICLTILQLFKQFCCFPNRSRMPSSKDGGRSCGTNLKPNGSTGYATR